MDVASVEVLGIYASLDTSVRGAYHGRIIRTISRTRRWIRVLLAGESLMSARRVAVLIASALLLCVVLFLALEAAHWIERRSYPDTELHHAVRRMDVDELPRLLAIGFDTELRDKRGETALLKLVRRGPEGHPRAYITALEILLDARANANATDKDGRSPIHFVLTGGWRRMPGEELRIEALAFLLDHGANPNAPDPRGWTPLVLAGQRDLKAAEILLVEAGAKVGAEEAVAIGDLKALRRLLERDPNLAHRRFTDADLTLLLLAVMEDELEMVSLLLEAGADPNQQDLNANGALHSAVLGDGSEELIRLLLDAGADPNLPDGVGQSPLHLASAKARPTIVSLLLDAGADVGQLDRRGGNALHHVGSYERGSLAGEVIRILLDNGADVSAVDLSEQSPLVGIVPWVTNSEQSPLVDILRRLPSLAPMLLEAGADPNARDQLGRTLLSQVRDVELARTLIEYGADVSVQGVGGATLLHAIMRNSELADEEGLALAELYLSQGLDGTVRDRAGHTALDVIRPYRSAAAYRKWVALFERHGVPESLVAALRSGNTENALEILQRDPEQASRETLSAAIRAQAPEIARSILELGVDPNAPGAAWYLISAMSLAKSDPEMASRMAGLLLEYGLDPDVSVGNEPALVYAVRNRHGEIAKQLLASGANPNVPNQRGMTALDYSMRWGLDDIRDALIAHGARRGRGKTPAN